MICFSLLGLHRSQRIWKEAFRNRFSTARFVRLGLIINLERLQLIGDMNIMSPDERETILAKVYEVSVGSDGADLEATLEASLEGRS